MRIGREADAVGVLGDAVAQLTGKPDESANLATALLNRSFACLTLVRVNQARADLVWCLRIAGAAGHDLIAAKARHNLGYCDLLAGDIPAALQLFDAAAAAYRLSAPGFLLVLATDKASALLAAGLASDAARELDGAMASSRRQRLGQNLAEAQLARVAAGQPDRAARILAAGPRRGAGVPLGGRLLRRLARAELAEREGRPGTALAELRAGLALVQTRRGRLGSIDLQTGTGALGADLA